MKMNDLPKHLFDNITQKGYDWGIVCVEHKRHIPCRPCLYQSPATIPYSEQDEDIKIVRDYQRNNL
jgi:hypothetical protein